MFDWIAVENYTLYYYNIIVVTVMITFFHAWLLKIDDDRTVRTLNFLGYTLLTFIIIYMGLRPVSAIYFGDMARYARSFEGFAMGNQVQLGNDLLFTFFTRISAEIMSVTMYFLLCAFLYVYPLYIASKRFFTEYWYYGFLTLVVAFTFWASGTNGMRNGLATSFFLLGLSLNNKVFKYVWFVASIFMHKSLLLPTAAYFLTANYKKTKIYLWIWFLAIPLSLIIGGFFESFFLSLGFGEEERLQGYLTEIDDAYGYAKTGFRWDFLIYSATGVFAAYYYIFKKKFEDPLYTQMVNMYLIVNAFWILIIRANFSNRFAYLSWFMLAIIIIYPLLKVQFSNTQHRLIGKIIVLYFLFSYLLNVVLA